LSVDEDWVESAKLYRQMTEVDPFNGYAWRRLGRCYTNIRSNQRKAIRDEELSDSPSERKLEELRQDLLVTDQLALKAWEKAREHPRYRRVALYQLAAIRTARSELDEAMALLEEFVFVEGYILPNDLHKFRDFGSSKVLPGESENDFDANREETTGLHQFDRFWELAKEEQKERRANSRPGQIEPQGMRSVPPRK
jgi:tetratricopeptide (TPR) repeat protein